MTRRTRPARILLRDDERGVFPVLEAVLVALLVLTAILFFTSVQRPTTGHEQGGIDLAKVAADTLQIVQVKYGTKTVVGTATPTSTGTSTATTSYAGSTQYDLGPWATKLLQGDTVSGTTTAVDANAYLSSVLPAGSRYSLRLSNGMSSLTLISSSATDTPFEARVAEALLLPNWAVNKANPNPPEFVVVPGQVIASTDAAYYALVDPASTAWKCYQAPSGDFQLRDGGDSGTAADFWRGHWQSTPNATAPWKTDAGQVPKDALYGIWKVWPNQDCTGTAKFVQVVSQMRQVTDGVTSSSTTVTSATAAFTSGDVGRLIVGTGIPVNTRITAVASATSVTISNAATTSTSGVTFTIAVDTPYNPYSLQLVVWFGA